MNAVAGVVTKRSLVTKFAEKYSVEPNTLLTTLKATAFQVKGGEATNEQMAALLIVADQYGLNPFTKEIFAFPDSNKGIVPVVSVDGWSRIINDHREFDGVEFLYGPEKGNHHEWIECVIYRKDRTKPVRVREFFSEVARETGPWKSHPNRMHRHKVYIQCGRIAFGFGGIYDDDEAERIIEKDVTPVMETEKPSGSATEKLASELKAKAELKPRKEKEIVVDPEPKPASENPPAVTLEVVLDYIARATSEDVANLAVDMGRTELSKEDYAKAVEAFNKKYPNVVE